MILKNSTMKGKPTQIKHLRNTAVVAGGIFQYELTPEKNILPILKKLKYLPTQTGAGLSLEYNAYISENRNILAELPQDLNDQIKTSVDYTVKTILSYSDCDHRIFSSWVAKVIPEGYSESHRHWNSWLSGVYYPDHDPEFKIRFFNDSYSQFSSPPKEANDFNATLYTFTPVKNTLLIFHSHLRHKIQKNLSNKDRYSISFNILPKNVFGDADSMVDFK